MDLITCLQLRISRLESGIGKVVKMLKPGKDGKDYLELYKTQSPKLLHKGSWMLMLSTEETLITTNMQRKTPQVSTWGVLC